MFTKQHYKAIGLIIKKSFNNQQNESSESLDIHSKLISELCNFFKDDNPRFDKQKFIRFVNRGD